MKHVLPIVGAASILFGSGAAHSQSLLYKPSTAAQAEADPQKSPNCNATMQFSNFVGMKVAFLAKTLQFQRFGYSSWHYQEDRFNSPNYQALAGKIGTIIAIDMSNGADAMFKDVIVKMDDNGRLVTTRALHDTISDVVLLNDIDFAKSRYVGKTLWIKTRSVRESQDTETYDGTKIRKFSAVKVVDVVPGTFQYDPVDFVIETNDHETVLVPSSVSVSNVSADMITNYRKTRATMCGFDEIFLLDNPRLQHNWSEAVWRNIELERVVVGMTLEQVLLSKGNPRDFNETNTKNAYSSQLVYDDNVYVYINDQNIVTAVQE
ncbi:hypothetical protein [Parasphingorhabdus sp.]|uniref:hypothetical protein n=1 Tax=Parasphingorhabdus sp. TaxID=2709688 RepID=UPI002F925186